MREHTRHDGRGSSHRRRLCLGLIGVLALAAGLGAFTLTRALRDAEPAVQAQVAPAPGLPDTSIEGWALPIKNEEIARPRYRQVVGGIELLTEPFDPNPDNPCKDPQFTTPARTAGTDLAIRPDALPASAVIDEGFTEDIECAGVVVHTARFYVIPQDQAGAAKHLSGQASWFDVEHGGRYYIVRVRSPKPRWAQTEVPSEQWEAAVIAGLPAAIGRPILPDFGNSGVIVWDEKRQIVTWVQGTDRPIAEVIRVAEGLVR
jgi:hypothetical protein